MTFSDLAKIIKSVHIKKKNSNFSFLKRNEPIHSFFYKRTHILRIM